MRVTIIAPDLRDAGGVREKALFVARSLRDQLGASVRVLSLATSRIDTSSIVLHQPRTWQRSLVSRYTVDGLAVDHVGAVGAEIEVARYRSRRVILDLVTDSDALHVVCGTPALANVVSRFGGPVIVHFASFVRHERRHELRVRRSGLDHWRQLMTSAVTRIERTALRRADAIIAVNRTRLLEAQILARPGTPAEVVHTGVDTEWFSPGPYQEDGYLLTVGRLNDSRKNVPLLLRAYAAARKRMPSLARLVLGGPTAPQHDDWALVSALGLTGSVTYIGSQERRALADIYRGASMFVLSSDEEGQGIVIVEAMASGLPVVATSCVGPSEIITNGVEGLLKPVGSVSDLADAMVCISADPVRRRQMSQAARLRAVRDFSLDRAGARLCHVYRSQGLAGGIPRRDGQEALGEA
jgi:glycosyltransferase involved in cell wall biosynthesis